MVAKTNGAWKKRGRVQPNGLAFSRSLREYRFDRLVLVSKCQRSCRASEAQRVGWNAMLAGTGGAVISRSLSSECSLQYDDREINSFFGGSCHKPKMLIEMSHL